MSTWLLRVILNHENSFWKFLSEKRDMEKTESVFVRYYPHIQNPDDETGLRICKHFQGIDSRTTCTVTKDKGLEVKLVV